MAVQPINNDLEDIINQGLSSPNPQYIREDQEENRNQLMITKHNTEIINLETQQCNPLTEINLEKAKADINLVKKVQELIFNEIDQNIDLCDIQGNYMACKSALEKVLSLTDSYAQYKYDIIANDGRTGEYEVAMTAYWISRKTGLIQIGMGTASSHEDKTAFKWEKAHITEARYKMAQSQGKGFYDPCNDCYLCIEELDTRIQYDQKEYRVPLKVSEIKGLHHATHRKAEVRALRNAIEMGLNLTSRLKELSNEKREEKKAARAVNKPQTNSYKPKKQEPTENPLLQCSECGVEIDDDVMKYSLKWHNKCLCRKCQPKR
jgi:hypothetical protein